MSEAQHILDEQTDVLRDRLEPLAAKLGGTGLTVPPLAHAASMFTIAMAKALCHLPDEDVKRILDELDASLVGMLATFEVSKEAKDAALLTREMFGIAVRQMFELAGDAPEDQ